MSGSSDGWAPEDLKANPENYVIEVVLSVLVGGFLSMGRTAYRSLLSVFDQIARVPDILIGNSLEAFATVGRSIFGLVEWFETVLRQTARAAGPFAPLIVTAGYVLLALTAYSFGMVIIQIIDIR